jgi:hypothetical protein
VAQGRNEQKQTEPPPRKGMSDFRKALLWTAIPILVLSVGGAGTAVATGGGFAPGGALGGILWVVAILVSIGFAVARRRQIALGILAGAAIGLVGLGLTCFTAPLTQLIRPTSLR